ncbi:MAG: hypothetical protein L0211_26605 [Planctomycetaceae bacterium]|nr:hypothetical protein [Planctomycetaceae bacterium]
MRLVLKAALVLVACCQVNLADEPKPKISREMVQRFVADLDSDDQEAREKGEKALVEAGLAAIESTGAAALSGSAERRFRAIAVLGRLVRSDDDATVAAAGKALEAAAASGDAAVAERAKEELSYFDRLQTMRGLAEAFELHDAQDEAKIVRVPLIAKPLLRFEDRERENRDGTLWGYGDKGRPKALIAVFPFEGRGGQGLDWWSDVVSTAAGPLQVTKVDGIAGVSWSPKNSGEEFHSFPNAPAPAGEADERLVQMHALAERLEGRQNSKLGERPYDLALWPKLLHRYSDASANIVEGGVFAFVHDSNPEIIVLIEAQGKAGAASWKFALARHTAAPLHVDLDGEEVWGSPPPADFMTGRNSYWVLKRRPKK